MSSCCKNPKKSSATKGNKHKDSGCPLFTQCSFNVTKYRVHCYSGKDCMEGFCKALKEHGTKLITMQK